MSTLLEQIAQKIRPESLERWIRRVVARTMPPPEGKPRHFITLEVIANRDAIILYHEDMREVYIMGKEGT